jgi:hypothetical protein
MMLFIFAISASASTPLVEAWRLQKSWHYTDRGISDLEELRARDHAIKYLKHLSSKTEV